MTTKRTNPKNRKSTAAYETKTKVVFIFLGLLVLLAIIWGAVALSYANREEDKGGETVAPGVTETVEQITRSVTGKTVDEDREDAVQALTKILNTAHISPGNKEATERLAALDKDDLSVVDPGLEELIQFSEDSTPGFKISTYQGLITVSAVVHSSTINENITPTREDYLSITYADPEIGSVFIPLNIYVGQGAAFSFEMVYVDGEWKLAPYSFIDAVKLSAMIQESLTSELTQPQE